MAVTRTPPPTRPGATSRPLHLERGAAPPIPCCGWCGAPLAITITSAGEAITAEVGCAPCNMAARVAVGPCGRFDFAKPSAWDQARALAAANFNSQYLQMARDWGLEVLEQPTAPTVILPAADVAAARPREESRQ